eukprot:5121103-Heterocapsa_arctica.AAC.1
MCTSVPWNVGAKNVTFSGVKVIWSSRHEPNYRCPGSANCLSMNGSLRRDGSAHRFAVPWVLITDASPWGVGTLLVDSSGNLLKFASKPACSFRRTSSPVHLWPELSSGHSGGTRTDD